MSESKKLTPTSRKVLKNFDKAARIHGWEQDQGGRDEAEKAKKDYDKALHMLEMRIVFLETQVYS